MLPVVTNLQSPFDLPPSHSASFSSLWLLLSPCPLSVSLGLSLSGSYYYHAVSIPIFCVHFSVFLCVSVCLCLLAFRPLSEPLFIFPCLYESILTVSLSHLSFTLHVFFDSLYRTVFPLYSCFPTLCLFVFLCLCSFLLLSVPHLPRQALRQ